MGRFAQDFLATANVRCRLDLPVQVPAWPLTAETRHNLFLAFKESLNNAVKHAAATEVRISLALRDESFALIVKDNGHGFDTAQVEPSKPDRITAGNGLTNMKTRLERIGGRCEIASESGSGTSVSFIVVFAGLISPRPSSPSASPQSIV
jgi:signal transduction histidine kinase